MEPRIINGHIFRCKQDVKGYYRKGIIYECECENSLSGEQEKYSCGFITNDIGNIFHAWPYYPDRNPLCNDSWTDFFEDLGEKPAGMVVNPYGVGDKVKWLCFDDYEVHTSKITSIEIEVVKDRGPIIVYKTRINLNGRLQEARFTMSNIRSARK